MNVLWSVSPLTLANLTAATDITFLVPTAPMVDWRAVNIGTGAWSRTSIRSRASANCPSPVCTLLTHQIMFKGKMEQNQASVICCWVYLCCLLGVPAYFNFLWCSLTFKELLQVLMRCDLYNIWAFFFLKKWINNVHKYISNTGWLKHEGYGRFSLKDMCVCARLAFVIPLWQ